MDKVSSSSSLSKVLIRKFAKQIECVKVIVINMQNRFAVTQLFIEKIESLVRMVIKSTLVFSKTDRITKRHKFIA